MKPPGNIIGWPVRIVRGLTGSVQGPIGPFGPTGGMLMGSLGPTGPIGRLFTGSAGSLVTGPTGPVGLTGANETGPSVFSKWWWGSDEFDPTVGPTGPSSGLALNIWNGGLSNPTGPFNSQYGSAAGLQIKVSPTKTGRFFVWFAGTFSNNVNNGGMDINLVRGTWPAPGWNQNIFGVTLAYKSYRNIQPNMRTEFTLNVPDDDGWHGYDPTYLLFRDWFFDLSVVVNPVGSFVTLYDIEWVIFEI